MYRGLLAALACLVSLMTGVTLAHTSNQPPHQLYRIGDLKLESGDVIKDFAISYVTHGTLNAKKIERDPHGDGDQRQSSSSRFLIGPGKALDTNKFFIICTDAIGNGLTTSPSNSTAQPHMKFPKFLIRDMVASQKLLLDHLGIEHLVAVIGPSMGGMQTLQWGVSYPDMMDSLVAIVPLAKTPVGRLRFSKLPEKPSYSIPPGRMATMIAPPEQGLRLYRAYSELPCGAIAGNLPRPIPEPNGCSALADGAGNLRSESVRRGRLDLPDLGLRPT
jgi:homoserine O-acetyltransferase